MNAPCNCEWLALNMNEPGSAIRFCEQVKSFVIDDLPGGGGGGAVMHYCPGGGGKFPDASKPVWVPLAPRGERERLQALAEGLNTVDQMIARLGNPDYDKPMYTYWPRDGAMVRDETIPPTRNIEYYGLSEWFNLEFYLEDNGDIRTKIQIKSLPPRHIDKI